MRNILLKTTAVLALSIAAYNATYAAGFNTAPKSDIPLYSTIFKSSPNTIKDYLTDTTPSAWCAYSTSTADSAFACYASSYGSGNFQSNRNGGILNQLLQYATGTELAFVDTAIKSVIPQAILDTFGQNWFTVPTMGFRLPVVGVPSVGVSSFTAAHWQSWIAVGFNIVSAINMGATTLVASAATQQYTIDNTYMSDDFGTVNPRYLTNQILEIEQLLLESTTTSVNVDRFSAGAAGIIFIWTIRDFTHTTQNQYKISILCQPNYDY